MHNELKIGNLFVINFNIFKDDICAMRHYGIDYNTVVYRLFPAVGSLYIVDSVKDNSEKPKLPTRWAKEIKCWKVSSINWEEIKGKEEILNILPWSNQCWSFSKSFPLIDDLIKVISNQQDFVRYLIGVDICKAEWLTRNYIDELYNREYGEF